MAITMWNPYIMAAWSLGTMLKFRSFSTFFRTPVLFKEKDDKVTGVLLKLNRPKRPAPAYFKFVMKCNPELQAKYPDKTFSELSKLASKLWKEMSEKEKSQYNLEFAMEMEEYKVKQNHFLKDLEGYKHKKEWMEGSKKITEADRKIMGKPVKPKINFVTFCSYLKKSSPNLSHKELFDKAKVKWKSDDEDRRTFEKEMHEVSEKYESELLKWEESMYNKGYFQLVRPEILKIFHKSE